MNLQEMANEIVQTIPDANLDISIVMQSSTEPSFRILQVFTRYIRHAIDAHKIDMVENYLTVMEKIYRKGSASIRSAVENVFLFSLDNVLLNCTPKERNLVMSKMPAVLSAAYYDQIYRPGT